MRRTFTPGADKGKSAAAGKYCGYAVAGSLLGLVAALQPTIALYVAMGVAATVWVIRLPQFLATVLFSVPAGIRSATQWARSPGIISAFWNRSMIDNSILIQHALATALSVGGADKWAGMVKVREVYPRLTDQPLDESHLQRLVLKVNSNQAGRDAFFRRTSGRTNKQLRTETFTATLAVAAAMGPISRTCRAALLELADALDHDRLYAATQISAFPSADNEGSVADDSPGRFRRPILRVVKS